MKYKVGDKVRVREDLKCGEYYGGVPFTSEMNKFKGMEFTIARVNNVGCYEVLETLYDFTEEILEPVEEMSAEEALRLQAEMCTSNRMCSSCPIGEMKREVNLDCTIFISKYPKRVIEALKQWKVDHEKKPIETEFANIVRVIEDTGDTKKCVYEEEIPYSEDLEEAQVRVLKEYCKNHDGKFIAVMENICRVKE